MENITRRNFLKTAAVGGVVAAGAGMGLAGCSGGTSSSSASSAASITVKVPSLTMSTLVDPSIETAGAWLRMVAEDYTAQTGTAVDVVEFEIADETKALTETLGTEDAPDVLYEGYFNMSGYIHNGYVAPIDDIIDSSLREDIDDSLWELSQADGKTYMMPFLSLQNMIGYNKDLMKECGLESYFGSNFIGNWSVQDWETILDTLAEKLPGETYPMFMYGANDQGDTHIMTLCRCKGSEFFDKDSKFNLETEEGIAGLEWIRGGIDRGWYPQHPENLEIADTVELLGNGQMVFSLWNNAYDESAYDFEVGRVNFPSTANPEGICTSFVTGFQAYDNGDEAKLAAAKDFIKFVMSSDWADYAAGAIPAMASVAEKYASQMEGMSDFVANSVNVVNFTDNNPNWRGVRDVFWPNINSLLAGSVDAAAAAKGIDTNCNAAIEEGLKNSTLHE